MKSKPKRKSSSGAGVGQSRVGKFRIGVFDSGVGGLTVLNELRRGIPEAEYIYLGDTANLPYGSKSTAQIRKLSQACARTLRSKGVDLVVVACGSASSCALPVIRKVLHPLPVVGVVEPGIEAVLLAYGKMRIRNPRYGKVPILVLATQATVKSQAYPREMKRKAPDLRVEQQACPLLVPLIEEGWTRHPVLQTVLKEYVAPFAQKGGKQGVALLGCTHYPWIQASFEKALPGWVVVNSAQAVTEYLKRLLGPSYGRERKRKLGRVVEWIFTDPDAVPSFVSKTLDGLR